MTAGAGPSVGQVFLFGPFQLQAERRELLRDGRPVAIGSRAFDILVTLVQHAETVVGKQALIEIVWPHMVVSDSNLSVNIAALRRVLGRRQDGLPYIVTVPGRGYAFVAPLDRPGASILDAVETSAKRHNLPNLLTRLIGREADLACAGCRIAAGRMTTIVGPGGIGKTVLALAAARERIDLEPDGVWLLDLAPLTTAAEIVAALAATLSIPLRSGDPAREILTQLQDRQLLLVLDNCEHLIEEVAEFSARLMAETQAVRILATSREALQINGESILILPPLLTPPPSCGLSAENMLRFPAVLLFVERATSAGDFQFDDLHAAAVERICGELDGLPLAIEFAAARVQGYGVDGVAEQLEDRFRLLAGPRRGGAARHRTMAAALDWSHDLLSERSRRVLYRLAVFRGGFNLEAACAVACDEDIPYEQVPPTITGLVAKSLVVFEPAASPPRFRLLETVRAYAAGRLDQGGWAEDTAYRHAAHCAEWLRTTLETADEAEYLHQAQPEIDNIRAALSWSLSPAGDARIGLSLATASAPLWFGLSLLRECQFWTSGVLARIPPEARGSQAELDLLAAHATASYFTEGQRLDQRTSWSRIRELALELNDTERTFVALLALWTYAIRSAEFEEALSLAHECDEAAGGVTAPEHRLSGLWALATTTAIAGRLEEAEPHLHRFLGEIVKSDRRPFLARFGFDRRSAVRSILSVVQWLRGSGEQALETAKLAVTEARMTDMALPICEAMLYSGVTFLYAGGHVAAAEEDASVLIDLARKHDLDGHRGVGIGLQGICKARRDDLDEAGALLSTALDELVQAGYREFDTLLITELIEVQRRRGRLDDAQGLIRKFEGDGAGPQGWWAPEYYRSKGDLLWTMYPAEPDEAMACFSRALALAETQGAEIWRSRAAMKSARCVRSSSWLS